MLYAKNSNRKPNTIGSYAMKKFGIEHQGFYWVFVRTEINFNCVFGSKQLREYAIRSFIWGYGGRIRANVEK